MQKRFSWVGVALAAVVISGSGVACSKRSEASGPSLGEPIGVRVDDVKDEAGKTLGGIEGAFAVTAGQPAEPLVPGMARAISTLGKRCAFMFGRVSDPVRLRGAIEGGNLSFVPATDRDGSEVRCVRDALHGQKVTDAPAKLDFGFELRELRTADTKEAKPK